VSNSYATSAYMTLTCVFSSRTLGNLKHEVGRAWLTSSKIATKASHHQTAYSSILQAQQNGMTFSFVQGCKLTKTLGEPLRALQELTHSIQNVPNLVLDLTDNSTRDTDPPPMAKVTPFERMVFGWLNTVHRHCFCAHGGCMRRTAMKLTS
jgi:hypothetical protein